MFNFLNVPIYLWRSDAKRGFELNLFVVVVRLYVALCLVVSGQLRLSPFLSFLRAFLILLLLLCLLLPPFPPPLPPP